MQDHVKNEIEALFASATLGKALGQALFTAGRAARLWSHPGGNPKSWFWQGNKLVGALQLTLDRPACRKGPNHLPFHRGLERLNEQIETSRYTV